MEVSSLTWLLIYLSFIGIKKKEVYYLSTILCFSRPGIKVLYTTTLQRVWWYNFGECESSTEKVSLQTSITLVSVRETLQTYIYIYIVKFENLIIGLHVFIIFSMLAKFQENQRSIAM